MIKLEASTWGFEHHILIKLQASTWGFQHCTMIYLEASTWGFEHHILVKLKASTWCFKHHITYENAYKSNSYEEICFWDIWWNLSFLKKLGIYKWFLNFAICCLLLDTCNLLYLHVRWYFLPGACYFIIDTDNGETRQIMANQAKKQNRINVLSLGQLSPSLFIRFSWSSHFLPPWPPE